jgi:hypothetical protein
MVVFILSAVDPRTTIHHSGAAERQGNLWISAIIPG